MEAEVQSHISNQIEQVLKQKSPELDIAAFLRAFEY